MAKAKKEELQPMAAEGAASLIMAALNKNAKGMPVYQAADHFKYTYGVPVPPLIVQWMIGGSNILPMQRIVSTSGAPKSFKSTFAVQMGIWFAKANGLFFDLDNESKTSAAMLDAMTWWCLSDAEKQRIMYQETKSIDEWISKVMDIRKIIKSWPPQEKGSRVPVFIDLDSLTGKTSEDSQDEMAKEGEAQAREFPVTVMHITNFLKKLDLTGMNLVFGYVRHAKPSMDPNDHGKLKESGGQEASFRSSISIMMKKLKEFSGASHPALPNRNISYEGKTIKMWSEMSCLGPDRRTVEVDILWQYVPYEFDRIDEEGNPIKVTEPRQIMLYDWEGALGEHLWTIKYGDPKDRGCETDKEQLNKALLFTATGKKISCVELGLEDTNFTLFGRAIEANKEVRQRVAAFLGIRNYLSVQQADIFIPKKEEE